MDDYAYNNVQVTRFIVYVSIKQITLEKKYTVSNLFIRD